MSNLIDKAFLSLLSTGDDLLKSLLKGGERLQGDLQQRIAAYQAAHNEALNVAKFAHKETPPEAQGQVFGGGPVSNPPPPKHESPPNPAEKPDPAASNNKHQPPKPPHHPPKPTPKPPKPPKNPPPPPPPTPPPSTGTLKPYPRKVYCLLASDKGPDSQTLGDPNISGYRLRTGWASLGYEPDWSFIDNALGQCKEHGKKLGFGVGAGVASPSDLYSKGGAFQYAMDHTTIEKSPPQMPLPWDPKFQEAWFKIIDAMGARYDKEEAVSYIVLSGFMQLMEGRLATSTTDGSKLGDLAKQYGFKDFDDAYLSAAKVIIARYVKAFPTTAIILTTASVAPGSKIGDTVVSWAKAEYPEQFGTMTASLHATPPPHKGNPNAPVNYPLGRQPIFSTTDKDRLYLPGPAPSPWPAEPQPCDDLLANGVDLGIMWVELYGVDCKNKGNASVIKARGEELEANVPKGH